MESFYAISACLAEGKRNPIFSKVFLVGRESEGRGENVDFALDMHTQQSQLKCNVHHSKFKAGQGLKEMRL
jgi:hypothetical protein